MLLTSSEFYSVFLWKHILENQEEQHIHLRSATFSEEPLSDISRTRLYDSKTLSFCKLGLSVRGDSEITVISLHRDFLLCYAEVVMIMHNCLWVSACGTLSYVNLISMSSWGTLSTTTTVSSAVSYITMVLLWSAEGILPLPPLTMLFMASLSNTEQICATGPGPCEAKQDSWVKSMKGRKWKLNCHLPP